MWVLSVPFVIDNYGCLPEQLADLNGHKKISTSLNFYRTFKDIFDQSLSE